MAEEGASHVGPKSDTRLVEAGCEKYGFLNPIQVNDQKDSNLEGEENDLQAAVLVLKVISNPNS